MLNRTRDDIFAEVRRITDGRRADIVFEHTGADTWPISMQCLKWGGTIVTCGATSGFDAHMDIRLLWNKQQNYLGSHLGNKGELIDAMRFVERGLIKPVIDRTMRAQGTRQGAGPDGDQRGGGEDRDAARRKEKGVVDRTRSVRFATNQASQFLASERARERRMALAAARYYAGSWASSRL